MVQLQDGYNYITVSILFIIEVTIITYISKYN